jgi:hypothetical protein
MSRTHKDPSLDVEGEEPEAASLDDDDVKALLKSALRVQPPPQTNVLRGVQKKIRQRSKGKFYSDGWSTSSSPRTTYFVTSLVMLVVIIALYLALVPGGFGRP